MRGLSSLSIVILAAVAAVLFVHQPPLGAQTTRDGEAALKAAEQREDIQGDLKGAIDAYKTIAAGRDKTLAAKALLRMAGCYQKLGDVQASAIYEQLVRDYRQQPEAAEAQARLIAMHPETSRSAARRDWVAWTTPAFPLAVSPDGRFVAFDHGNISVHDMEMGTDRVLVKETGPDSPGDAVSFSEDGQQLAYTWWTGKAEELDIVSLHSPSTPRVLLGPDTASGDPFDWTHDGQSIVVVSYRKDNTVLGLVSVQNGSMTVLKSVTRPSNIESAHLSRDDKYIAFEVGPREDTPKDIHLISIDGKREIPVVQDRFDKRVAGWSPDNSRLLFTSNQSGSNVLYAQRIIEGRPEGLPEILTNVLDHADTIGMTDAGALYYLADRMRTTTNVRTATVDFTSGRLISAPADVSGSSSVEANTAPDFSPDGRFLAYVSNTSSVGTRYPNDHRLVMQNVDSGARTEIRLGLKLVSWLRWAPGGDFLISNGYNLSTTPGLGLWRIDRNTGAASRIAASELPNTIGLAEPAFSPDGATVYYRREYDSTKEVALLAHDMRSGADRELFRSPPGANACVSPDGKIVYYRKPIGGVAPFDEAAFVARDLATGAERELIRRPLGGIGLSPDGKYIVTGSNDAPTRSRSALLVPTDGSPARELMRVDLPKDYSTQVNPLGYYMWSPDSRSVILQTSFGSTRVERRELWWVPIDGHAAPARLDIGPYSDVRIHPDNRRIAFRVPDTPSQNSSELHVLEHFLPVGK